MALPAQNFTDALAGRAQGSTALPKAGRDNGLNSAERPVPLTILPAKEHGAVLPLAPSSPPDPAELQARIAELSKRIAELREPAGEVSVPSPAPAVPIAPPASSIPEAEVSLPRAEAVLPIEMIPQAKAANAPGDELEQYRRKPELLVRRSFHNKFHNKSEPQFSINGIEQVDGEAAIVYGVL